MNNMNFDWDDLRLFLAVARGGGLSVAARATGKSAPTLGRRMLALERAVGAELFQRLPRGYALTTEGEAFLARIAEVEARIAPLAQGGTGPVLVKVSAGAWMTQWLCAHAAQIAGEGVQLRFIAADHRLDIARREAVIGIRNARPQETGLAARKMGQVRFAGYATGADVAGWIKVASPTPSARWVAEQGGAGVEVTTPRNALDLALAGVGRAVLPCFVGDARPGLIRVTEPIAELTHDQWLVTHHEDRFAPPVRQTFERVAAILSMLHSPRNQKGPRDGGP